MPEYRFRCEEHRQQVVDIILSYNQHGDKRKHPKCPECEATMRQVITAPAMIAVDNMPAYKCIATNQVISNRKQRQEVMARNDLIDANDFGPPKSKGPAKVDRDPIPWSEVDTNDYIEA